MKYLVLLVSLIAFSKSSYAVDINLNSFDGAKQFRTVLTRGFENPANIAFKYVAIVHGCGTNCQLYWIVNKETGDIIDTIKTSHGLDFKKESKLAIAKKYMSEGARYYLIDEDKVTLIREDEEKTNAN